MLDWGSYGDSHSGGLASLPGCPGVSNLNPVVSLCSTTGYQNVRTARTPEGCQPGTLGLRDPTNDPALYFRPRSKQRWSLRLSASTILPSHTDRFIPPWLGFWS